MARTEQSPATPAARSILILDDNLSTAKALTQLLQPRYPTVSFHRAEAALAFAKENVPLAAIVDVHLPDMNGLLVAQRLRSLCGTEMPIFILSGDTSMETLNSLPHVGATYFFSKPVGASTLLGKIAESLGNAVSPK